MPATSDDMVTTRLASLCLRRGRPRGFALDNYLVRAALVVDLAIGGALRMNDSSVDLHTDRAAGLGVGSIAIDLTEDGNTVDHWITCGGVSFRDWEQRLVKDGVWRPWPRLLPPPLRWYRDVHSARTAADRERGRRPRPGNDYTASTLAVLALGRVCGLFGPTHRSWDFQLSLPSPEPWVVAGMGDVAWAGALAVEKLVEVGNQLRWTGFAVG